MRTACLISAAVIAFILQARLSFFDISPNLTAAVVYYIGINSTPSKALLLGSLTGFFEDSIAGGMLGPNLLGKGATGFLSASFYSGWIRWTPLTGVFGVALFTVMDSLIVFISKSVYAAMPVHPSKLVLILLVQAVINSAIGFFLRRRDAD